MRRNRRLKEAVAFPLLLGLGLLQMAGALLQIPLVSGLGAATKRLPAPQGVLGRLRPGNFFDAIFPGVDRPWG